MTPLETCLSEITEAYDRHTQALANAHADYDTNAAPARHIHEHAQAEANRIYSLAREPIARQFDQAIAPAKRTYERALAEAKGFPGRKGAATRAYNKAILPAQRACNDAMKPIDATWSQATREAERVFELETRTFERELSEARAKADQGLADAIKLACETASELTGKTVKSCNSCHQVYDTDTADYHEAGIDCSCGRCRGKPACYVCTGSFCMCFDH
jgi:F0F1-type ATP synthase membrane subunit b/b'